MRSSLEAAVALDELARAIGHHQILLGEVSLGGRRSRVTAAAPREANADVPSVPAMRRARTSAADADDLAPAVSLLLVS